MEVIEVNERAYRVIQKTQRQLEKVFGRPFKISETIEVSCNYIFEQSRHEHWIGTVRENTKKYERSR